MWRTWNNIFLVFFNYQEKTGGKEVNIHIFLWISYLNNQLQIMLFFLLHFYDEWLTQNAFKCNTGKKDKNSLFQLPSLDCI